MKTLKHYWEKFKSKPQTGIKYLLSVYLIKDLYTEYKGLLNLKINMIYSYNGQNIWINTSLKIWISDKPWKDAQRHLCSYNLSETSAHTIKWLELKRLTTLGLGKDVEKLSCATNGNVRGQLPCKAVRQPLTRLSMYLPSDPAIPLLDIYPESWKQMFIQWYVCGCS